MLMSNAKQLAAVALIGLVAGLAGGALAVSLTGRSKNVRQSADVIRAKRFEAIGENGTLRARFGLASGDVPSVILFGPDGSERLWIGLDNIDEPVILMHDIKGDIRAYFGHEGSDTASPADDDWSLSFYAPGDTDHRSAAVGSVRSYPSRKHRGFVGVSDEVGRWSSLGR